MLVVNAFVQDMFVNHWTQRYSKGTVYIEFEGNLFLGEPILEDDKPKTEVTLLPSTEKFPSIETIPQEVIDDLDTAARQLLNKGEPFCTRLKNTNLIRWTKGPAAGS